MSGPITIGEVLARTDNTCHQAPPAAGQFYFDEVTGTSNVIAVRDVPVAIRLMQTAYPADDTDVCVDMVWGCNEGEFFAPLTMSCQTVCINSGCRIIILPVSGRYRLRYTGSPPFDFSDLLVVYDDTPAHSVPWQTR